MPRLARIITTVIIVGRNGFYKAWETWQSNKREEGIQMDTLTFAKVSGPPPTAGNVLLKGLGIPLESLGCPAFSVCPWTSSP